MQNDLAVYVHWPYCARICPYCDFNVYKRREDTTLLPAILADLQYWRGMSGPRRVTSLHFGGGTPSLMTPDQVAQIINCVANLWNAGGAEIALEANPHEADLEKWRGYRDAGITRMSLGVQSFQDNALKFLGRDHDGAQAKAALDMAVATFPSVSADLIFGWAGQSIDLLTDDLAQLIESGTQHLSTYQLTIEDGTAFAKAEDRGQARAVDTDLSAALYDHVRETIIGAGFEHYEVSNFAKPGHRSKHNLAYWQGRDYVGVGPGAHGRITVDSSRQATVAALQPGAYVRAVRDRGTGIAERDTLSPTEVAEEYVLMGLRISDGISLARYRDLAGKDLPDAEINALSNDGFLQRDGDRLVATQSGRVVLNAVTERLLLA